MVSKTSAMKFEIEKFDGRVNFGLWQKRVKAILVQQGLHKALLGKEKKSKNMSVEDWEDLDLRALSTIQLCLADEVMYNVLDEETTTGLWNKLEKLYMTKSLTNKLYLKRQLYSLRMEAGLSLLDHLNNFNRLIAQLLSVDVKVEEEDKALLLLSSLPDSYDHLVTTILYGRDTLNMEEVTTTLLSNEMRRKPNPDEGVCLIAKGSDLGRGRSNQKGSSSGRGRGRSKSRPRLEIDQCAFCKEKGHWKKDCPKLQNRSQRKEKKERDEPEASAAVYADSDEATDYGELLTVSEGMSASSDIFLLDSGCSTHVCSRMDWFATFQERRTGVVSLGDGSTCDVKGVGTVRIRTSDGTVRTLGDVAYVPKLRRNLISLGRLDSKRCGYSVVGGVMKIVRENLILMHGRKTADGLYSLEGKVLVNQNPLIEKKEWKRVEKKVSFAPDLETAVADDRHFQMSVSRKGDGARSPSTCDC